MILNQERILTIIKKEKQLLNDKLNHYSLHLNYFKKGNLALDKNDLNKALAFYYLSTEFHPNHIESYRKIGEIIRKIGKPRIAAPLSHAIYPQFLINFLLLKNANNLYPDLQEEDFQSLNKYKLKIKPITPFSEPITIDKQLHSNFRKQFISYGPTAINLPYGEAWGSNRGCVILTKNNETLRQLSNGNIELLKLAKDHYPKHYIDGNVIFISGITASGNFYHWMFDVLPRLFLLKEWRDGFDDIDYFFFNPIKFQDYHYKTFDLLGIDTNKIISTIQKPHIKARHLITTTFPYQKRGLDEIRIPNWVCDIIRKNILPVSSGNVNFNTHLYIGRRTGRGLINEEAVISILKENFDLQIVYLEDYDLFLQAQILRNAEFVIAPHGAGLANLVFCKPSTKIIEFFHPEYINVCYWILANQCKLQYAYLIGDNTIDNENKNKVNPMASMKEISICLESLKKLLTKFF